MVNVISTLVGEELQGSIKYCAAVTGNNGSIYGIPFAARRRVVKFNPVDESMDYIGPDFEDGLGKWMNGAMTESGVIYCPPRYRRRGILKIDTNTDTATVLDRNLQPDQGFNLWQSCALALDGCIYFMPAYSRRIMKLDPNNNDAMSSVGVDLGEGGETKYSGTVVGIDGCVYGIPYNSNRIVKYDPINNTTSFVGDVADEAFLCGGDGALGRDGCIYAITQDGRVLKIDTTNNVHCFVGNTIESNHYGYGWSRAILGIDGCIYWPPMNAPRILKYDPHSNQTSLIGDDFGNTKYKWATGTLAADGVIYCLPLHAKQVLSIDPMKEFSMNVKTNMNGHLEPLKFLFQISDSDKASTQTFFDCAVKKFGIDKVFEVLEEYMPRADRVCSQSNLYPFMIAASYENSALSVIYYLLRRHPSLLDHSCTRMQNEKKRKHILVSAEESDKL